MRSRGEGSGRGMRNQSQVREEAGSEGVGVQGCGLRCWGSTPGKVWEPLLEITVKVTQEET